LQDQLAGNPDIALAAVTHAMALPIFYGTGYNPASCLKIEASAVEFVNHTGDSKAGRAVSERHGEWVGTLPKASGDLWDWIVARDHLTVLSLLAFCAARTVYAVQQPWNREPRRIAHADKLAQAVELDMTGYWTPTVNSYLGRVTKACILEAVREAVSEDAAENISGMKKQPMAEAAEQLLIGTGWLPPILRTPETVQPVSSSPDAEADHPALAAE
jgi:ParB family chromosome partitioning protein